MARTSIESMEMMDRPMAVADIEAISRRDRGADPGLGIADRCLQVLALRQSRCDGGGERAAGSVSILGGNAWAFERNDAIAAEEIVDALGALPVAAFDQHRLTTHRLQPFALALDRGFARGDRFIQQRGCLVEVWRDQRGARYQLGAQRF